MNRRKQHIINKRYQFKYIGVFLAAAVLAAFISAAAVVESIHKQIDAYSNQPILNITHSGEIILPVVLKVSFASTGLLIVLLGLILVFYYKYTERISRRVGRCIRKFESGEFCEGLKDDSTDFENVESAFNNMMGSNRMRIMAIRETAHELEGDLAELERDLGKQSAQARLTEIREKASRIQEVLKTYRLD